MRTAAGGLPPTPRKPPSGVRRRKWSAGTVPNCCPQARKRIVARRGGTRHSTSVVVHSRSANLALVCRACFSERSTSQSSARCFESGVHTCLPALQVFLGHDNFKRALSSPPAAPDSSSPPSRTMFLVYQANSWVGLPLLVSHWHEPRLRSVSWSV